MILQYNHYKPLFHKMSDKILPWLDPRSLLWLSLVLKKDKPRTDQPNEASTKSLSLQQASHDNSCQKATQHNDMVIKALNSFVEP